MATAFLPRDYSRHLNWPNAGRAVDDRKDMERLSIVERCVQQDLEIWDHDFLAASVELSGMAMERERDFFAADEPVVAFFDCGTV
jgi:hypothetical protein